MNLQNLTLFAKVDSKNSLQSRQQMPQWLTPGLSPRSREPQYAELSQMGSGIYSPEDWTHYVSPTIPTWQATPMLAELQAVEREAVVPSATLIPSLPRAVTREERARNAYITRARAANVVEDVAERQVVVQDMFRLPAMLDVAGRMSYSDALNLGMGPITREFAQRIPTPKKPEPQEPQNKITPTAPSEELIRYVAEWEQFSPMPYRGLDVQNLTVGYGHVITNEADRVRFMTYGITHEEARELLRRDIQRYTDFVNNFLESNSITLSQHQYDALITFTFNAGPGWMSNPNSRVRSGLISGDFDKVREGFMLTVNVNGVRAQGLVNRRLDELEIFFDADYQRNH